MKITKRQLRKVIRDRILSESPPTFNLRVGDTVRHKDDDHLGTGRIVAKSNKRDRTILVRWDSGTLRHDPSALIKEFWGKKKKEEKPAGPDKFSEPLKAADVAMSEVVSSLWGPWDTPPRPDLLKKAQELHKEIKAASAESE